MQSSEAPEGFDLVDKAGKIGEEKKCIKHMTMHLVTPPLQSSSFW
jgi:hypothetical protein